MVYVENRPESLFSFAERFIGTLLYGFLSNSNIVLKEDLHVLIDKSSRYVPKTIARIKLILEALAKRKKKGIFTELLCLPELIHQETGKYCVVIFDEFHNLEHVQAPDLYEEWSKILLLQKNTMYIIVSSMTHKAKTILAKNLSLLFGNFETINVEPFDIRTSDEYLRMRMGELPLSQALRNFLVHFSAGYPSYLNMLAMSLLKSKGEDIADILEELLFNTTGILNQRFSNYMKRFLDKQNSQDYLAILYLSASGNNKIKDIAHILHKTTAETLSRINHLCEIDAVTRSADFIKLNDRVFGFWLKFVYQEKLQSLSVDSKKQKVQFRDNIKTLINEFLINTNRSVPEIMAEVLKLFEDDIIQIERKRFRLTHFREIKPLEFSAKALQAGLIGRAPEGTWIMGFKDGSLTEDDVTAFAKECKKYQDKLERKIIVALDDIDSNARLRAFEERIMTWDISQVNLLMDLYSKPRLVVV